MRELSERQKTFAAEYIKNGGNGYQAAIAAGYKDNTAKDIRKKILEKGELKDYIAEKQAVISEKRGHDIMTLSEIQELRSKIARGEIRDSLGFEPEHKDRLKAMSDLEKALTIKEEREAKRKAEEEARNAKEYHLDLYDIPDTFHSVIRDIRDKKHLEYVLKGGRGSTKSTTFAMIIIELMKNHHDVHAVVCRKVGNTIKDSVYNKIKWAIG